MILKIKKGEYGKMFTNELKDLLAGLYQKYGCTQEVLQLSNIIANNSVISTRSSCKSYFIFFHILKIAILSIVLFSHNPTQRGEVHQLYWIHLTPHMGC